MLFQVPTQSGAQINQVFRTLQSWGFADALLPFLLLFVLIFAILEKIGTFKERKINGIIAFVISALVVIPHITGTYRQQGMVDPVAAILNFLPSVGILLVTLLLLLMLTGFIGGIPNAIMVLGMWVSIGVLVLVVLNATFPFATWLPQDPNTIALVIVLLVMGLIIWFITREPEGGKKGLGERLLKGAETWFGPETP